MKHLIIYTLIFFSILGLNSCEKEKIEPANEDGDTSTNNEVLVDWDLIDYSTSFVPNQWSNTQGNHYQWIDFDKDRKLDVIYVEYTKLKLRKFNSNGLSSSTTLLDLNNYSNISGEPYGISSFTLFDHNQDGFYDIVLKFNSWPWSGASFLVEDILYAINSSENTYPSGVPLNLNGFEDNEFGPSHDYNGDGSIDVNFIFNNPNDDISDWLIISSPTNINKIINGDFYMDFRMKTEQYHYSKMNINSTPYFITFGEEQTLNVIGHGYVRFHPTDATNHWNVDSWHAYSTIYGGQNMIEEKTRSIAIGDNGSNYSVFLVQDFESTTQNLEGHPLALKKILSFRNILDYTSLPIGRIPNFREIDFPNGVYSIQAIDYDNNGIDELIIAVPHESDSRKFNLKLYSINESDSETTLEYISTVKKGLLNDYITDIYGYTNMAQTFMYVSDFNSDGKLDIHLEHQGKILLNK